jgi:hypothetical protein
MLSLQSRAKRIETKKDLNLPFSKEYRAKKNGRRANESKWVSNRLTNPKVG